MDSFPRNTILAPTDFSPNSVAAFNRALELAEGDDPHVIVLHVVDLSLAKFLAEYELRPLDEVVKSLRQLAYEKLEEYQPPRSNSATTKKVTVKKMVCEGNPFLQIVDHARDLLVDAVVIGKVGSGGALEKLLFGSTVEKVVRGCSRPVIVLPLE